jgi:hypothetical protein
LWALIASGSVCIGIGLWSSIGNFIVDRVLDKEVNIWVQSVYFNGFVFAAFWFVLCGSLAFFRNDLCFSRFALLLLFGCVVLTFFALFLSPPFYWVVLEAPFDLVSIKGQ